MEISQKILIDIYKKTVENDYAKKFQIMYIPKY